MFRYFSGVPPIGADIDSLCVFGYKGYSYLCVVRYVFFVNALLFVLMFGEDVVEFSVFFPLFICFHCVFVVGPVQFGDEFEEWVSL